MTNRPLRMFLAVAGAAIALLALPDTSSSADLSIPAAVEAPAEPATELRGDAYFYVGGLNVTDGFSDRLFLGLAANAVARQDLGTATVYLDRASQIRPASQAVKEMRLMLMAGRVANLTGAHVDEHL